MKGWLQAQKWLLLRRISQLAILSLFLLGPLAGIWIVRGSFSSSTTLGFLPLTDPLIILQSVLAGHAVAAKALIGGVIVFAFYSMVGGRVYCSWACPVNLLTDAAAWLNRRLDLKKSLSMSRFTRYWLFAMILILASVTGSIVWEWLNPVTIDYFSTGTSFWYGIGLGLDCCHPSSRCIYNKARLVRTPVPGWCLLQPAGICFHPEGTA
jgi:ferredoxin-type protein NapH